MAIMLTQTRAHAHTHTHTHCWFGEDQVLFTLVLIWFTKWFKLSWLETTPMHQVGLCKLLYKPHEQVYTAVNSFAKTFCHKFLGHPCNYDPLVILPNDIGPPIMNMGPPIYSTHGIKHSKFEKNSEPHDCSLIILTLRYLRMLTKEYK